MEQIGSIGGARGGYSDTVVSGGGWECRGGVED